MDADADAADAPSIHTTTISQGAGQGAGHGHDSGDDNNVGGDNGDAAGDVTAGDNNEDATATIFYTDKGVAMMRVPDRNLLNRAIRLNYANQAGHGQAQSQASESLGAHVQGQGQAPGAQATEGQATHMDIVASPVIATVAPATTTTTPSMTTTTTLPLSMEPLPAVLHSEIASSTTATTAQATASAATTTATTTTTPPTTTTEQRPTKKRKQQQQKTQAAASSTAEDHPPPTVRYKDLGGIDRCIEDVRELIEAPLSHPEVFHHLNIQPPRGVLLHGPPGCGKTQLARAVAGELGVPFIQISAPSVVSGMSGESEKRIREVFAEAAELAPCLLFIDEIDAITPKRENAQREMERRIVAQLLTCMDDLSPDNTRNHQPVMVIGATNRPDSLDAALRRAGRFDREICMGVPDEKAREQILRVLTAKLRLGGSGGSGGCGEGKGGSGGDNDGGNTDFDDFDYRQLAKITPGYVGADLQALTTAAGMFAVKRIFGQLSRQAKEETEAALAVAAVAAPQAAPLSAHQEPTAMDLDDGVGPSLLATFTSPSSTPPPPPLLADLTKSDIALFLERHPDPLTEDQLRPLSIMMSDFRLALGTVQPSSKREGFATVPDVSWGDIGALARVRDDLRMSIVEPIRNPELFASVGIHNASGVLLWGPPGCGKTLLAKAVANESHCNFISVKGPELLNKVRLFGRTGVCAG